MRQPAPGLLQSLQVLRGVAESPEGCARTALRGASLQEEHAHHPGAAARHVGKLIQKKCQKMWDDFVWALLVIFSLTFHHLSQSKSSPKSLGNFSPFQMAWPWVTSRTAGPVSAGHQNLPFAAALWGSWFFFSWGKLINFEVLGVPKPDLVWFCDIWRSLWRDNYDTHQGFRGCILRQPDGPTTGAMGHGHGCRIWMWILTWRMAWPWICGLNAEWDWVGYE